MTTLCRRMQENHKKKGIIMENQNTEKLPKYGELQMQFIREKMSEDPSDQPSIFDKFVLDRGFLFKSEEELKAGYDRYWKSTRNILITADEFIVESELGSCPFSDEKREKAKEVYGILANYADKSIISTEEVYSFAKHNWCLDRPEAIEVYQIDSNGLHYVFNSCSERISQEEAIVRINNEWGFEASRIKILGVPYYSSTDWQFIRFDCCGMSWLWAEESLYKVYE